jgi:hypothetical protein
MSDPIEIEAACLFYLCRNRAFTDGNKRTALAACLVFLETNGLLPAANLPTNPLGGTAPRCHRESTATNHGACAPTIKATSSKEKEIKAAENSSESLRARAATIRCIEYESFDALTASAKLVCFKSTLDEIQPAVARLSEAEKRSKRGVAKR